MSEKPHPLQIPLPGGSGIARTGAVQFRHDWPGLFVRGDEACAIADCIRTLQRRLDQNADPEVRATLAVLARYASLIECEVKV